MIPENEIRVRSWFVCPFIGMIQLEPKDCETFDALAASGIKVTPGLLKAAGFDHDDSLSVFTKERLTIHFCIHDGTVDIGGKRVKEPIPPLHIIQGLYYYLTGEELEIKLPRFL